MKYYSEKLKKVFDDVKSLDKAEKEFDEKQAIELKKKEERASRAKEVEDAWKKYQELLKAFIKDYGSYHQSVVERPVDLFDLWFGWPF